MFLNIGAARDQPAGRPKETAWPEAAGDTYTIVHNDLTIVGELRTDGHVEVNGRIEGTCNSRSVLVREDGWIEGTLLADVAEIRGTVVGSVRATTVIIGTNARVHGSIFHNNLTIEPGAELEGRRPWRPRIDRNEVPA